MTAQLILLFFLFLLSAVFSATETAFTSLSLIQKQHLLEKGGRRALEVYRLTDKPDILLTTLLIGNNLANIGATALVTSLTIHLFGSQSVALITGVLTLFVLIFGEVTPKQIALARNEGICLNMAYPVYGLTILFRPFIWIISGISSLITRLFAGKEKKSFTLENLLQMVSLGENIGIVESYEQQMVKNVFRINDTPVKGITTYRTNVFCLDRESYVEEVLEEILEKGFSRIPVYQENPEHIVGIVLMHDVLKSLSSGEKEFKLKEKMVEPFFIPETRMVHDLFVHFKREKINIAIVLDEYGGLTGLVTKEDVIEEIFGELYDENEEKEADKIVQQASHEWLIQGDCSFYHIQDRIGLELKHDQRILTIGGYLIEKMGEIPEEGATLKLPEGSYIIGKVNQNRIEEVLFRKSSQQEH
ncbi:MAG: hypothetical protein B6241_10205 [Spirochaetaceae bacterium 4572_59]|nr:MAG: hypothetical protein B6241_10205 [Spirochaetaceae bacterium 4572_59]